MKVDKDSNRRISKHPFLSKLPCKLMYGKLFVLFFFLHINGVFAYRLLLKIKNLLLKIL